MADLLYEYKETAENIKSLLKKNIAIAENTEVDDIDLTAEPANLHNDAPKLAGDCFSSMNRGIPALIIAQREAYDFVTSNSRLSDVFSRDRAYYYLEAIAEFEAGIKLVDYQSAVMQRYIQHGTGK